MTNPPTDEMIEAAARAIFVSSRPKNMTPADWDSGALLGGKDDSYRHAILNQARAALEAVLSHQGEVVEVSELRALVDDWSDASYFSDVSPDTVRDKHVNDLTTLISKAEKV